MTSFRLWASAGFRSVAGLMAAVAAIAVLLWLVATAIAQVRFGRWVSPSGRVFVGVQPDPFWPGYLHRLLGLSDRHNSTFRRGPEPLRSWTEYVLPSTRTLLVLLSPYLLLRLRGRWRATEVGLVRGSRARSLARYLRATLFGSRRSVAGLIATVVAIPVLLWLVITASTQARADDRADHTWFEVRGGTTWQVNWPRQPVPFWPGYLHRLLGLRFMWLDDPNWDSGRYILPVVRTMLVLLSPYLIFRLVRGRQTR